MPETTTKTVVIIAAEQNDDESLTLTTMIDGNEEADLLELTMNSTLANQFLNQKTINEMLSEVADKKVQHQISELPNSGHSPSYTT